ncbi:hypothetical protein PQ465_06025 [Sphingobacterium oryzagri]|uniref:Ferritin-like domain-containing protein n=1 Tax=Sphingobacterium oryzagri TaxID=3025669 RepID=A0ABY7WK12_9SPHI|nr:hypothetical protein [Sphingobacterium sp. KACC 22765]WDF69932.1 hypothetical protein PQ465_06025 [Sphingobacterium sp. KACC 22765]
MNDILIQIVENDALHARWLNSLSFMENMGARKISACEDPETVDIIQLKHAAEEHRHAYYLKKQLQKLQNTDCQTYQPADLLAAVATRQYLQRLDIAASRYVKRHFQLTGAALRYAGYLFVTYAIEVRADALYPVYQDVLSALKSRVMVKSIILEEEGHLEEMISQLAKFSPDWEQHAQQICVIEGDLFKTWLAAIEADVKQYGKPGIVLD